MSNSLSHVNACNCAAKQDSNISSSQTIELETCDHLLVRLLNVRKFLSSSLFPRAFSTRFNIILERLSEAGRTVPYTPPSAEIIQSVGFLTELSSQHVLV